MKKTIAFIGICNMR